MRVLRVGRQWTVHVHAWRWLRRRKGEFDRIVDQINTIPFMTPLYVPRAARRFLIYQLAREFWLRETRGAFKLIAPVAIARAALPPHLSSHPRDHDLGVDGRRSRGARLLLRAPCAAADGGALRAAARTRAQAEGFRVVMLGRLTPAKFVEEGIKAFAALRSSLPAAELQIAGGGDVDRLLHFLLDRRNFLRLADDLHASRGVVHEGIERIDGEDRRSGFRRCRVVDPQKLAEPRLPGDRIRREVGVDDDQIVAMPIARRA